MMSWQLSFRHDSSLSHCSKIQCALSVCSASKAQSGLTMWVDTNFLAVLPIYGDPLTGVSSLLPCMLTGERRDDALRRRGGRRGQRPAGGRLGHRRAGHLRRPHHREHGAGAACGAGSWQGARFAYRSHRCTEWGCNKRAARRNDGSGPCAIQAWAAGHHMACSDGPHWDACWSVLLIRKLCER